MKHKKLNKFLLKWNLYCQRYNQRKERENFIICSKSRLTRFVDILKNYVDNRPLKDTYYAFNKIKIFTILNNLKDIEEVHLVKKFFNKIKRSQKMKAFLALNKLMENRGLEEKEHKIEHQNAVIQESVEIFKNKTKENLKKIIEAEKKIDFLIWKKYALKMSQFQNREHLENCVITLINQGKKLKIYSKI